MKIKKSILAMVGVLSISSGLMVGCASYESNKALPEETINIEDISKVKKDLSKDFEKAITDSGLRVVETFTDGSFVLSLGNLEYSKVKPKQVLNYSMTRNDEKDKEILSIQCVKDYSIDGKLSYDDKFVKAIYNIFKLLTNAELTEKEFFNSVKKTLDKGDGVVELPYKNEIPIEVFEVDKFTKGLKLITVYEFNIQED